VKRLEIERQKLELKKSIKLPDEPEAGPDVAEIVFRAPGGSGAKISRRFFKTESVKVLYDFVRTLEDIGFDDSSSKFELF